MTCPESDFRSSLLSMEPLDPQRQQRFDSQVRDLVDRRIRGVMWVYWFLCLLGAGFSTWFFGRGFVLYLTTVPNEHQLSQWPVFFKFGAFVCFFCSALATGAVLYFLIRRRVDGRVQLTLGKLMPVGAFLLLIASFLYTCADPGQPGATWFGVYALAAFVFTFSINLWHRVVAADYHAQERALRIEYRLAELAERMAPTASKP